MNQGGTDQTRRNITNLTDSQRREVAELCRRFKESERTYVATFLLGFFLMPFLWIITYQEHARMLDIKSKLRTQFGIDPDLLASRK